jgi:predicted acetyltransferase
VTLPDSYTRVQLTSADRPEVIALDLWAFPTASTQAEALGLPDNLPWAEAFGYRDQSGQLVAINTMHRFDHYPVPGAYRSVAGLSWVCVHPAHRRRGLLSAMIAGHFARCRERGNAVSVLTASEPAIYGRFGYGQAADHLSLTIPRRAALRPVSTTDVTVRMESLDPTRHGPLIEAVHAAAGTVANLLRPGWVSREEPGIRARFLADPPGERAGQEPLRILIAERGGQPVAYALFARHGNPWNNTPRGSLVSVREYAATDPAAVAAVWQRLLDLDLTTAVTVRVLPVDDPLLGLLVDVAATQPRVSDLLWIRLIDVPRALAERHYAADIDVVLEVTDTVLPANAGRWHLRAAAMSDAVEVSATTAPADLTVDSRELGAAYLGGRSLVHLAAAGLVHEHTSGCLARASTAFSWPVAPACSWIF